MMIFFASMCFQMYVKAIARLQAFAAFAAHIVLVGGMRFLVLFQFGYLLVSFGA